MQIGFERPWWSYIDSVVRAVPYVQLIQPVESKHRTDYVNAFSRGRVRRHGQMYD